MRRTIHDAEVEQQAMGRLAKVKDWRTQSQHVPNLFAEATGRTRKESDCMEKGSFWDVTLRVTHRPGAINMTTPYSMGTAHREPPTCDDVLSSLCMDAQGYDNALSFEDWCASYDMPTDSRKAEAAYRACGEAAKGLRHLLGSDYDAVVTLGAHEWQAEF